MVNNALMGYRGELLVIFKNRTSKELICCVENIGKAINAISKVYSRDRYYITKANKYYDKVMNNNIFPYKTGDRVCQLLVRRREKITWDEVETLEELGSTERGAGAFGHTGK